MVYELLDSRLVTVLPSACSITWRLIWGMDPESGVEGDPEEDVVAEEEEEEEGAAVLLIVTWPSRVTVAKVLGGVVGLGGAGATGAGKMTGSLVVEDVICFKISVLGRTRLQR